MKAEYFKYILDFKRPSGTSRGVMTKKETWFIRLTHNETIGIGECGILRGLSYDDVPGYEDKLKWSCQRLEQGDQNLYEQLKEFPSIQFGIETALRSLESPDPFLLFPSEFTRGKASIDINGLIWMGDEEFMREQISSKLDEGFDCIKMKIGAIDFETEYRILQSLRKIFSAAEIEIRVDANGAFKPGEALDKLKRLAELELHSIEQPIQAGQWEQMAELCDKSPLPIALDEELIGVTAIPEKAQLLRVIRPQYIILKPSLIGGFTGSREWIGLSDKLGIKWWITSALESNIGLNAISQFTFTLNPDMPQGLGTGSLFTNNFNSPLEVKDGTLHYRPEKSWEITLIES